MNQPTSPSTTFARLAIASAVAVLVAACGGGGGNAPTNQAPTVALTAPGSAVSVEEGTAVTLSANAADADGTVAKVEFFDGTTKIGEATVAPFQFVWNGAAVGVHQITAVATDDDDTVATSAQVSVTVTAPAAPPVNQTPTVAFTSPASGFKPNAPAAFNLVATAADTDGSVAKVEFFKVDPANLVLDGTTLVGEAVFNAGAGNYQLAVNEPAAGTFTYVARATDNEGGTAASGSLQVIVNALPTVAIVSPANGAALTSGTNVTLGADASDSNGGVITKVEFFIDGSVTPLGEGVQGMMSSTYELAWNNVPVGNHTITAVATDNDGATSSTSVTVQVSVPPNVLPTVTLATPVASKTEAPATITLSADASDADGTITGVEFFNGATKVGDGVQQGATPTYQLVLANQPAGTYMFTARATDNDTAQVSTPSQDLTLTPNVVPTVSMTSPASFDLPNAVVLTADAADTDGVAKVEFFEGANKLGEDTTAPFAFTWAGATAGSFTLTAVATDTVGSTATSAGQPVTINPDPVGMWATLNAQQKAGLTQTPNGVPIPLTVGNPNPGNPNKIVEAGGIDAVEVLQVIGKTAVIPKFAASMAQAMRNLAEFTPTAIGTNNCPGGGTIEATPDNADLLYRYTNCTIGAYTYDGGAPYNHTDNTTTPGMPIIVNIGSIVRYTPTAGGFTLVPEGLKVAGNGAPAEGGEPFPLNATTLSQIACTGTGPGMTCLTNYDVNFMWGVDLAWSGYADNGAPGASPEDTFSLSGTYRSHFCESDPGMPQGPQTQACLSNPPASRHIKFQAVTNVGGRAIVYGSNGYSVVTRQGLVAGKERLQVVRTIVTETTVGMTTYPVGTAAPELFDCEINGVSGDWGCTLVVAP